MSYIRATLPEKTALAYPERDALVVGGWWWSCR